MKTFIYLTLFIMTTIIIADDFDNNFTNNKAVKTDTNNIKTTYIKDSIDLQDLNNIVIEVKKNIIKFQNLLPQIEGKIISLPKAGTIGIKFKKNKINIHEGMKLVSKRLGIDKDLVGDGILYLKYNRNKKLVGRYMRSQVGKFEISDKLNSKWYKPSFTIAFLKNNINNNRELTILLRNKLIESLKNDNNIKLIMTKKVNLILSKISKIKDINRELKKLFGQNVDYIVQCEVKKNKNRNILNISIISTYTNKVIFNTKIDTNL